MEVADSEGDLVDGGAVSLLGIKPVPEVYTQVEEIQLTVLTEGETSGSEIEEVSTLIASGKKIASTPENGEVSSSDTGQDGPKLKKTLNLFNAVTFIIGDIVGSGIFITPTVVLAYSGSFGMAMIFWVLGGILALFGGLVYVELGSMIKDSGADYAYIREGFSFGGKRPAFKAVGNTMSFLSVWSSTVIIRPLSGTIISKAFALYLCQALTGGKTPPDLAVQLVATSAILTVALINMLSVKLTAMIINIFTVTKVLALVFIIVLGVWQVIVGDHNDNFTNAFDGTSSNPGDISLAFYSILFSYSGWNALGYIVEESKNAEKNVSRGLYISIPIVTVCYVSVNVAYYAGLSKTELLSSPATALTFAESLLGKAGLVIVPLLVASSTFGSSLFGMYAGPRTTFSAARDGNLPGVLALLQNTSKTPVPAIILQCFIAILFMFGGTLAQLINGIGVTEWIFYMLVFIALIILRFTKRHERRPFKVWIIIPIVMIVVSLFLIVIPIVLVPEERLISLIVVLIILAGLPVYLILGWERIRPQFINRFSELLTEGTGFLFDSSSARGVVEK